MAPLRVGVVGLGEVAQVVHLPVIETLPDLYQLTAVCDMSPTLRKVVGDRYGITRRYDDVSVMVQEAELDCVLVLNSDEYHAECVRRGARRRPARARREADVPGAARGRARSSRRATGPG